MLPDKKQTHERVYTILKFDYRDELLERLKKIIEARIAESQVRRMQEPPDGELPIYEPLTLPIYEPLSFQTLETLSPTLALIPEQMRLLLPLCG